MSNLPSTNLIPSVLTNARIYKEGNVLLGAAKIDLPDFEFMSESIAGLGIAGEVDVPIVGHFASMTTTLTWNTTTEDAVKLLIPEAHQLDVRGSIQVYDAGTGKFHDEAVKVVMRTMPKKVGIGSFEPAKKMDSETELEVAYIKVSQNGKELVEVDKFNFIFRVNGTDYMSKIRQNMGMN